MWLDSVMNENGLIRLANLKRLGLSASELSERVGSNKSYWHGMLAGGRPFGEKAARRIEEALGLPRGSMDDDGATKPLVEAQYKPSPYALALARMFDGLPRDDEVRAMAFVKASAAMREAADQKNTPSFDAPLAARRPTQSHE